MPARQAASERGYLERRFTADGVRGVLATPEQPSGGALVLTHGAGSNHESPLLKSVARAFAHAGWFVLRYDLPFRQQRPKGPPVPARAARDREGVRRASDAVRALGVPLLCAGGHSYGGRQTAMLAAERPGFFDALLLLSYPLHPPGKPGQLRTQYFPELRTPAIFVHGEKDPFGSLEELRIAARLIPAAVCILPVAAAGHDLAGGAHLPADMVTRLDGLTGNGR